MKKRTISLEPFASENGLDYLIPVTHIDSFIIEDTFGAEKLVEVLG